MRKIKDMPEELDIQAKHREKFIIKELMKFLKHK
jgi:hypothetical protein